MKLTLISRAADLTQIACEGQITQITLHTAGDPLDALLAPGARTDSILMDLSRAQFIDSSGVGWMLKCHKHCKQAGGRIVYHSAPPLVRQTLELLQMGKVLNLAKDASAGRSLLCIDQLQVQVVSATNGLQRLRIAGGLIDSELKKHSNQDPLEGAIQTAGYSQRLLINLSPLAKLDAAGVKWMVKSHQQCEDAGGEVIFFALPDGFRNVIDSMPGGNVLKIADNEADAALQLRAR